MKREYDLRKGKRGPVIALPPEKVRITIRKDRDMVGFLTCLSIIFDDPSGWC